MRGTFNPKTTAVYRSSCERAEPANIGERFRPMHRTPEDLRQLATHCRYLAASCLTEQARQPLNEVADELELEADKQQQLRQQLIGFGSQ